MFGNYARTLDIKNRVAIPAKLRNEFGNIAYLSLGPDRILELRNESEFEIFKNKLTNNNLLSKDTRNLLRIMLGNTFVIEIDSQGRIAIQESTLSKATFTNKEVIFVGVGNKVELWPKDRYEAFMQEFDEEDSLEKLTEKLLKDGVEL